jgi:hypothetical protein
MNAGLNYLISAGSPACKDSAGAALVRLLLRGLVHYASRVAMVLATVCCCVNSADSAPTERPNFDQVANAARTYFQSLRDYRDGDLLAQGMIADVLDAIADVGWEVPDREKFEQRALADDSFLVRELSTPAGRRFARNIAGKPGSYERLDRLSTVSRGEQLVRDLIQQKGGDVLIEYLATTKGGRNLGHSMANTPNGIDLNKPTGRIYTAGDLMKALQTAYQKQAQ